MVEWSGYIAAAVAGGALVAAFEWLRQRAVRADSESTQKSLATLTRERDSIVVRLHTVEQEAAELRSRMAEADAARFAEAERSTPDASRAIRDAITRVLAVVVSIEQEATRLRAAAVEQCAPADTEQHLQTLRQALDSKEQEVATILDRLHTFETDWLREHTAVAEARARIAELEARLANPEALSDTRGDAVEADVSRVSLTARREEPRTRSKRRA